MPSIRRKPRRLIESFLQRAVQGTFEGLWSAVFRLAGRRLRRRGARPPAVLGPAADGGAAQRVLIVAPHPDDEVAGCAGTLLAHRDRGDRVTVACATDGRRSHAYGLAPEEMAARRRQEAEASARLLGAELAWLGLPEGEWALGKLADRLRRLLAELCPEVVYAPSRVDFHPEHERVARALAAALEGLDPGPLIRVYPVQVPLTPALANVLVPVEKAGEVELALACHATQLGSLRRCLRMRRYSACLFGVGAPVEELWQLDAGRYRNLHREPPARPLTETFRGMRYNAWSDPLAYSRGLRERRRLAAVCREGR